MSDNQRLWRVAVSIALLAIILDFAISSNTLADLGVPYGETGGLPLVKFLPGTYLTAFAAMMVLFFSRPHGAGMIRLFRVTPALAMFNVLILACAFYSIANVGISGAAIYVESYLSAGLLAIVLVYATDRQKRILAWIILLFCVLSIFLSIYEGRTQTHLIPLHIGDEEQQRALQMEASDEFRGAGLFGHPLTGSFMTALAVFLLLRMNINGFLKGALFTLLLVGLLSFGGRAALGVTLALVIGATSVRLFVGIIRRDLPLSFVATVVAASLALPLLLLAVINNTDIGDRIIAHMYIDDSAKVRDIQWQILGQLNAHDVLFGISLDRMDLLKYQIGLGASNVDIENFWLLMFLNLGAMGFLVFLLALGMLLVYLGRSTNHPLGWLMLLAAVIIDSTSNSLGRKSIDLYMLVAFMTAMTGYDRVSQPRRAVRPRRSQTHWQIRPHAAELAGKRT